MVVESFKSGNPDEVGARFQQNGRMMPDDICYVASWMTLDGRRCFQLMDAPEAASLQPWIQAWSDLVDFEVTEVMESAEYWAR